MHKIYALLDYGTLLSKNFSIRDFIFAAERVDAHMIQYRDKISSKDKIIENLKEIRKYWRGHLIINDRLDLISYADGVHLGQEDIREFDEDIKKAALFVREKIGNKIFGLSTHNKKEIEEANELPLDYIGLGAYRRTSTKDTDNILGDKLSYLAAFSEHPVAAIGGVRVDDEIENVTYLVIGSNLYDN